MHIATSRLLLTLTLATVPWLPAQAATQQAPVPAATVKKTTAPAPAARKTAAPATAAKKVAAPALAIEAAARADAGLTPIYAARAFSPLWSGSPDAALRRSVMLALLGREQRHVGGGAAVDKLTRVFAQSGTQAEAELGLTRAAMAYMERRAAGRSLSTAAVTNALAALGRARPGSDLELGLAELRVVEALGGWSMVRMLPPPSALLPPLTPIRPELELALPYELRPKPQPEMAGLRRRLVQSLDLDSRYLAGDEMDGSVQEAVRSFQTRHGLIPDGVVGARTAAVMNESVGAQIRQVELNMARPGTEGRARLARYIEVNVPAFELRLVESGRTTWRSRIIVGDSDTPTPLFDDWMRYIELNPSWYVPRSIVKEVLDKEVKEPGYMSKAGFTWRGGGENGAPARLIQRPGAENALGRLKFVFPNHHAVYIHDTPNRGLFSRHDRTLSHGCIRLEQPMGLAVALLGSQGWDAARIEMALEKPGTRRLLLEKPVPVFLDYRTATVDPDGRLQLWQDIYDFDAKGVLRFAGKGLPPENPPAPAPPPVPTAPQPSLPSAGTVAANEAPAMPPPPVAPTGL